jgi:hypothetical protein
VNAVDLGGYTAVLAINWNQQNEASINLDFLLLGLSQYRNTRCTVTDMWTMGADPIIVTTGYYTITKIAPNGNAALKI